MANDLLFPAPLDSSGNPFVGAVSPADAKMHPVEGGTTTTIVGSPTSATAIRPVIESKDGGIATIGTTTDAAYVSGAGTLVAMLKGLFAEMGVLGTTADTAWSGTGNATLDALLKSIATQLGAVATNTAASSTATVARESGGNLAATAASVTTIATNTTGLARETGGNLATTATNTGIANTTLATVATNTGGTATSTASIATNTTGLAKEAGGNLAALVTVLGTVSDTAWVGTGNASIDSLLRAVYALLTTGNTNTTGLAKEAGGNLAATATSVAAIATSGATAATNSATIATNTGATTTALTGVTTNTGNTATSVATVATNTTGLAKEAGHLATIDTSTASTATNTGTANTTLTTVGTNTGNTATSAASIATNTTGIAKEAGGHLAVIDTSTAATATSVATVATQSTTAATNTGTIATNTTGLAKEAGGHLATIDTSTASTATNVSTVNTTLGTTNTSLGTIVTQTGASGPLAKEAGGNLAATATSVAAIATSGATSATNSATIATNTGATTTALTGVTTNTGNTATSVATVATNTAGLAKEAGHLATIDTSTASTATNVATVNTTLGTTNTSLGTVVTQTGASGPLAKETGGNLAAAVAALGTIGDAAWNGTGNASLDALLKALYALLNGAGSIHLRDGTTATLATISTFHNGDNQAIQAAGGSILTAGVAQIQNPTGTGDAQRETGFDAISAAGVASGAQMMAQSPINVTLAASITGSVTAQAVALSSVTGTTRGVTWAIQKGMTLRVDTGASQEYVFLTALSGVNATGVFKNTHANGAVVQVFQYNQARDATVTDASSPVGIPANMAFLWNQLLNSGVGGIEIERSAAGEMYLPPGAGGNVAMEYEDIGLNGPPSWQTGAGVAQSDRAKGLQGKGLTALAITSATTGQATVTLSAAAPSWLIAGSHIRLCNSTTVIDAAAEDFAVVSSTGSVVTISGNIVTSGHTFLVADTFAANGPGLSGFTAHGIGIEEEALYDPISGLFYIERSATQDGMAATNIVAESVALWNGAAMDRWKGTSGSGNVNLTGSSNAVNATQTGTWGVTANAGTNLNTSTLALESGGHLATIDTSTASTATNVTTVNTTLGTTNTSLGTITTNTTGLAKEAGGHLATIDTSTATTAAQSTTTATNTGTIATQTTTAATQGTTTATQTTAAAAALGTTADTAWSGTGNATIDAASKAIALSLINGTGKLLVQGTPDSGTTLKPIKTASDGTLSANATLQTGNNLIGASMRYTEYVARGLVGVAKFLQGNLTIPSSGTSAAMSFTDQAGTAYTTVTVGKTLYIAMIDATVELTSANLPQEIEIIINNGSQNIYSYIVTPYSAPRMPPIFLTIPGAATLTVKATSTQSFTVTGKMYVTLSGWEE